MDWMLAGLGIDDVTGRVVSLYGRKISYFRPPAAGWICGLTFTDNSLQEEEEEEEDSTIYPN